MKKRRKLVFQLSMAVFTGVLGNFAYAKLPSLYYALGPTWAGLTCIWLLMLWRFPRPAELVVGWSVWMVTLGGTVGASAGLMAHFFAGAAAAPVWFWAVEYCMYALLLYSLTRRSWLMP